MRIGIDLGGTKIEIIVLDEKGVQSYRRRLPTPSGSYEEVVATIVELVAGAEEELGVSGCTVGAGTPGALSPATGRIKNSNSTCLIGRPLDRDLERALGRPVRLENDANCFALSEATDGAAADARVVFGVILGTGTGGGIVVDGRVLTGPNAIAGEWGHNPIPWPLDHERPGPRCYCGRDGCIETFLSGPALARDHEQVAGRSLTGQQIVQLALEGDQECVATLERLEDRLARALASVVNVLDPDVIVLGGGVSNIARLYSNVPAIWGRYVFSDDVRTRLAPARHGDSSGVRGAAWLWDQWGTRR
jgi:predicted NBD/HSP70 family sugar kinase